MLLVKKYNVHKLKEYGFKKGTFEDIWKIEPCLYLKCENGIKLIVSINEIDNKDFSYIRMINHDVDTYAHDIPDELFELITKCIVEKER